ncbi:hypothetical protein [Paenibacillus thermotolerans]|uniref:hypothetical protein n=1 Tax=Paenibacillus thermotolerans TaxID=3027807 RepID=UPI002368DFDA|nr:MULTISPECIES: hypothetical protein [unclassified Paenibacillus]
MLKRVPVAIVHHANQYLITDGYAHRPGISATIGPADASSGLRAVLELHSRYDIPFHLHISGTLIEACAWHDPLFLEEVADLCRSGLIELIGSTYSQNIMTLFGRGFNREQLKEELRLYSAWLCADVSAVKGFWVPERVWSTEKLAESVADATLTNGGYRYILTDDRQLLQGAERARYDEARPFLPELYTPYRVQGAAYLTAVPISAEMRLNIPFGREENEEALGRLLKSLLKEAESGRTVIAVYGDDMEKAAGIPPMWNRDSAEHYERFLQWLKGREDAEPVLLGHWLSEGCGGEPPERAVGPGAYMELAGLFGAGEDYAGWAGSPAWLPYQQQLDRAWDKAEKMSEGFEEPSALLELARKHLLASSYETAWHDPGSSWEDARPAPWARALASHSRAAHVLLEAVQWRREAERSEPLEIEKADLDGDGLEEIVLRNRALAVVISPAFGGRILYAFALGTKDGSMFIGNPSDDWNLLEQLNSFMDVPMNHPGALADYGLEHDAYEVESAFAAGDGSLELVLANRETGSKAYGMKKRLRLNQDESRLHVRYEQVPAAALPLSVDIGLSPDYLRLLRDGRSQLASVRKGGRQGVRNGSLLAWVEPETANVKWRLPRTPVFGHGLCLALTFTAAEGAFWLGADTL